MGAQEALPEIINAGGIRADNYHAQVAKIEAHTLSLPQADCPVIHRFGPGICIREVSMKAGTFAIGHHQKFEHLNILLKGSVTMIEDDGSVIRRDAPMIYVSKPGRKIGYVNKDIVWQNIYATIETDIEKIEATFIDKSDACIDKRDSMDKLKFIANQESRDDYRRVIAALGFTEQQVRAISENTSDQVPFPYGSYKVTVSRSHIEGAGMFATASIEVGEVIAPARISGKRTPAGRYVNHAMAPNAKMVALPNGDINLVAVKAIGGMRGGDIGEEITVHYAYAMAVNIATMKHKEEGAACHQ